MRRLLIIGIGAGDPEYLTIQAIKALNRVNVFFVVDKGDEKAIWSTSGPKSATGTSRIAPIGPSKSRNRSVTGFAGRTVPQSRHGVASAAIGTRPRCATDLGDG